MKLKIWPLVNRALLILLLGAPLNPAFAENAEEDQTQEEAESAAEQDEEQAHAIDIPGCAFTAAFPSAPYTTKKCSAPQDIGGRRDCYDVVTFTQVYDMTTTIDVSMSCNQTGSNVYTQYNEFVMRSTLNGMARQNNLSDTLINVSEEDGVRVGSLSGTGTSGRQSQIYIAQLWVSDGSVLSVEGHLIGNAQSEADKAFGSILRSIEKK